MKLYQEGGFAKLQVINYQGRASNVDAYTDEIADEFKKRPPRSRAQAADRIEKITGIKRSSSVVREWLKRFSQGASKKVEDRVAVLTLVRAAIELDRKVLEIHQETLPQQQFLQRL